jgi:O-antigen polysaccharide polymerase Wzy
MSALFGFGSPLVTGLWALSFLLVVGWLIRQLLRRRLVTYLSSLVFFAFFLPIILQYPFAFSPLNGLTIGAANYASYRPHVDPAFLITMTGFLMLVTGYAVCGTRGNEFRPMTWVASGLRAWTQSVFLQLSSIFMLLLFGLLFAVGLVGPGGARNIAQTLPALRPLYNIAHILLPLTIALDLYVGLQGRRRAMLALAVVNVGLAALTGSRTAALGGLLLYAMAALVHASLLRRLSVVRVLKVVPIGIVLLILALYLGDVRDGQYNILTTIATTGIKLFYGNNFSDLRDFAWVRSYWDGTYYLGKTQLAGFLAFIPSVISTFRAEWNWGVVTTSIAGLDPLINPGLRAGVFGEMYFNFGLPGVLVAGFVYGYVIRRIHNISLAAARSLSPERARLSILAAMVTLNLIGGLLNTAGFFGFYITLAVLAGLHLLDYMLRATRAGSAVTLASAPPGHASPS